MIYMSPIYKRQTIYKVCQNKTHCLVLSHGIKKNLNLMEFIGFLLLLLIFIGSFLIFKDEMPEVPNYLIALVMLALIALFIFFN